jgi:hypothetical protein
MKTRGILMPIPSEEECQLLPMAEFIEEVEHHAYADWDGSGYAATETAFDPSWEIMPSCIKEPGHIPPWVTHVCWFDK